MHDIEALAPVMGKAVAHIREEKHEKVVCAYSGNRGAYAEQAISRYFDERDVTPLSTESFAEVFQSVLDGNADYGMIPIENSLAGSVYQNYDNFMRFEDVVIVGTVTLNIRHALLGVKGATIDGIKSVYSHPQGFGQCRKFLDAHKEWIHVDSLSTATAAQTIAAKKDPTAAAIASTVNASIYGLEVLQEDIENDPSNFTRFVVIQSKQAAEKSKAEKNLRPNMASFIFKTKNEPGALFNTLGIFSRHGINLTKLESRPLEGQPWTYWFYADAELKNADDDVNTYVKDLEDDLRSGVEDLRLLGIYPRDV